MCGLGDRNVGRHRAVGRLYAGVTFITANHCIQSVEHRDMHDGDRTRRAGRTELFPEMSGIARRDRSVIEPAGID